MAASHDTVAEPPAAVPAEPSRGGIALRLFVYTFPVVALVIAATLIALGWIGWQDRLETRQTRAQTAAYLTAHAVALPLWNLDLPVIRNQIAALGVDELVVHATVVDDKGATIATYGDPPEADRDGMVFASALIQDLSDRSRSTGRVEIVLSTADVIASLRRQVKIGLAAFLVLAVGVSVAVHFAARRLVARPLETLLAAMGEVERKRWTTVDWPAADEFGAAAQAFNRMVAGLQSGDEARRLLAELERANKRVLEGIAYASNIQRGLLPARDAVGGVVAEVEWLWQPVQDVGGDWLWAETIGGKALFVVADCTGHGVPGGRGGLGDRQLALPRRRRHHARVRRGFRRRLLACHLQHVSARVAVTDQPPIAAAGTSGYSLFDNEERILAETEALLRRLEDAARTGAAPLAQAEVTAGLRAIAEALRRSYAEERRLVRLSDRMQLDLQTANRRLAEQTSELSALNRRMVREVAQREALTRELEQLATIDALTGLANRRHLLELAEREVRRADRHDRPLAVLLLDLDDFKRVNDTRGHAAGDAALHAFAALCRSAVRTIDLVGRLGGEEFAIVMPDTEAPGALLVAERIRLAAAQTPVRHDSGEFIVTVSIGVAIRSGEGTDRLFARADKALYAAKHAGRNTVIVDHG